MDGWIGWRQPGVQRGLEAGWGSAGVAGRACMRGEQGWQGVSSARVRRRAVLLLQNPCLHATCLYMLQPLLCRLDMPSF